MFDHFCGHDRKRPDGLNLNGLSKWYGGKQYYMRSLEIKQIQGYLGQCTQLVNLLQIGRYDTDPVYLTASERVTKKSTIKMHGLRRKRSANWQS